MIRHPPTSTLFPTRRSSDLVLRPRLAAPAGAPRRGRRLPPRGGPAAHLPPRGRAASRGARLDGGVRDRKSTRLNSSHMSISYAVFCLKKKKQDQCSTEQLLS